MSDVYHALGLNMHQPPGNLVALHNSPEQWEAQQILWCYDRPVRMLEGWQDVARLHMDFSGTLLKQFEDPGIAETFRDIVDIEGFLLRYKELKIIEMLGTGLYHPVYPLTPEADWDAQTAWWQGLGRHLLGRERFPGFWPPEMGFCMEMIPMLVRHGYKYVLVDSWYIKPRRQMRWEEMRYRPYLAEYDGSRIVVIPRDRELSNAQESGLDPEWFEHEVRERTKFCDFPALVTTWTDGENGGWFRTTKVESGFWGWFYHPILQKAREGRLAFKPIHISEFIERFPPTEVVDVHRGAWNTGQHWGGDFHQWTGSLMQRRGYEELQRASQYCHKTRISFEGLKEEVDDPEEIRHMITRAYDYVLSAETSCNFYWGSRWVYKSFEDLEQAYRLLDVANTKMKMKQ